MEDNEVKKDLDIPVNVPPMDYIINGLGMPEFTKMGIGALIGLGIGILIFIKTGTIYACLIIPIITGMLTFIIVRRDGHTENFIDKLGFVFEFKRTQKVYLYEYYNIYEDVVIKGENESGEQKRDKRNKRK